MPESQPVPGPDHLDFIRIRGLESDDGEVFQGLGGSCAVAPVAPGTPGDGLDLAWGEIPEEAVTMLDDYVLDVNRWLLDLQNYDPHSGSRSNLPAIPIIPALVSIIATGGLSLPAVATVMLTQAAVSYIGQNLQNLANRFDSNSLEYILRKALLHREDITESSILDDRLRTLVEGLNAALLKDGESLIEKAWLHDGEALLKMAFMFQEDQALKSILERAFIVDEDGKIISILNERLKDLAFVDATIDFGPFQAHLRGKMIEY